MKTVKFSVGDTNYRRKAESESPFSKRSQVVFAHDSKTRAKLITVRERYYALFFSNEKESYLSRNQYSNHGEKSASSAKGYLNEEVLIGNIRQIRFSISKLIDHILERLKENPQHLFLEADRIRQVCLEVSLPLPHFEAFDRIESWDDFISLLNSIAETDKPFKFELLIAAIVQYAELCSSK
ncbi:MAG: hypothetical protein ABIK68_02010 [bacterium]